MTEIVHMPKLVEISTRHAVRIISSHAGDMTLGWTFWREEQRISVHIGLTDSNDPKRHAIQIYEGHFGPDFSAAQCTSMTIGCIKRELTKIHKPFSHFEDYLYYHNIVSDPQTRNNLINTKNEWLDGYEALMIIQDYLGMENYRQLANSLDIDVFCAVELEGCNLVL